MKEDFFNLTDGRPHKSTMCTMFLWSCFAFIFIFVAEYEYIDEIYIAWKRNQRKQHTLGTKRIEPPPLPSRNVHGDVSLSIEMVPQGSLDRSPKPLPRVASFETAVHVSAELDDTFASISSIKDELQKFSTNPDECKIELERDTSFHKMQTYSEILDETSGVDQSEVSTISGREYMKLNKGTMETPSGSGREYMKLNNDTMETSTGSGREYINLNKDTMETPSGSGREYMKLNKYTMETLSGSGREYMKLNKETMETPPGSGREYMKLNKDTMETPSGSGREYMKLNKDTMETPSGSGREYMKLNKDTMETPFGSGR